MEQRTLRQRLRGALCLAAAITLSASISPAVAQSPEAQAPTPQQLIAQGNELDRLLSASGLDEQIASLPDRLTAMVDDIFRYQSIPRDFVERFRYLVRSTHSAERLRPTFRGALPTKMSLEDARAVLVWLESPLGRKITAAEVYSSTTEGTAELEAIRPHLSKIATPQRRSLLNDLAQQMAAVDTAVQIGMSTSATLQHAISAHTRKTLLPPTLEQVQQEVEAKRPEMIAAARTRVRDSFLFMYRDLSDAELERYVEFASTSAARRYHHATASALEVALVAAARDLGSQIRP